VLSAFGAATPSSGTHGLQQGVPILGGTSAVLLPGGQGGTWRAGDIVLKRHGMRAEAEWVADVLAALPESPGFRVARPVRATSGSWTVDGWQAFAWTPGETDPRRCEDVLRAGAAFHDAIRDLPRPSFLDGRDDPWTFGDRVAWEELPLDDVEVMADLLARLAVERRPVAQPSQVVHGDLLGNVLFGSGAPVIIDWVVYHRPASWAAAVAICDALTWHDAPPALIGRADRQLLIRAFIYRIATNDGFRRAGMPVTETEAPYRRVVDLLLAPEEASR
jgi:uncharacterized protein (TIGR02569 family)